MRTRDDAEPVEFIDDATEADEMAIDVGVLDPEEELVEQVGDLTDEDMSALYDTYAPGGGGDEMMQFDVNLAAHLDRPALQRIATDLLGLIDADREARKKRDQQYEEGIRRTGLGDDAPGGAQFDGASRVVHPVLAEGAVDFAASAQKELLPPEGPARTRIFNTGDPDRQKRADRKKTIINRILMHESPSFAHEHEQLLTQIPLAGNGYIKVYYDEGLKFEFITVDRCILPFYASGFRGSYRRTLLYDLQAVEIQGRVRSGMYVEEPFKMERPSLPEQTKSERANAKVEGKEEPASNLDGTRRLYEVYCYYNLDGDDPLLIDRPEAEGDPDEGALYEDDEDKREIDQPSRPGWYVITIDDTSREIAAIYRNWDVEEFERSGRVVEVPHVVDYGFVPWEGAYDLGLTHMIGTLSGSITGVVRALLDSGHIDNHPGGLMLSQKGRGQAVGQNKTVDATTITEIDVDSDDIRKVFMPYPFKGPSATLFQLLGFLVDTAKGMVSTAEEKVADLNSQAPVGTTIALIEQGSKVMSSIHGRLHRSMADELHIIERVLRENAEDAILPLLPKLGIDPAELQEGGLDAIMGDEDDIIPVSDPHIFAEAQRFAILNEALKLTEMPQFQGLNWDLDQFARRFLRMLRVPDADTLLPTKPEMLPTDAVIENVMMSQGGDAKAFPEQDHEAHLIVHFLYLSSPLFGQNPSMAGNLGPIMLAHITEHLAFWFASEMDRRLEEESGFALNELKEATAQDDRLTTMYAMVAPSVMEVAAQKFRDAPKIIDMTRKLLEVLNPNELQVEALRAQAEALKIEAEAAQIEAQTNAVEASRTEDREDVKAGVEAEEKRRKLEIEERRLALEEARVALEAEEQALREFQVRQEQALAEAEIISDEERNEADNATRITIAQIANRAVEARRQNGGYNG